MALNNTRVLLLSKYGIRGASSRVRSYQYLQYFENNNIDVTVSELFSDQYLDILYKTGKNNKTIIFIAYLKRFYTLLRAVLSRKYDIFWIEKELFPWIPFPIEAIFYKTKTPVIVDYDDPIFHVYDKHKSSLIKLMLGGKIANVMNNSSHVSVSSHYMYDYAIKVGAKKVDIIPPAVDPRNFRLINRTKTKTCVIGWIGSPSATKYLFTIEKALQQIFAHNDVEFVLIGAGDNIPKSIPFTLVEWSEESEVEKMSDFDIGIMPLSDDFSSIARDHYKLVKYMSCSIPYVTAPVQESILVTSNNVNGFVAYNFSDWIKYLSFLINNPKDRERIGSNGYKTAKEKYCTDSVQKDIINIFQNHSQVR